MNRSNRELALVVLAGAAGAAVALHSARAPGLVALAAAGALLATRGAGRRLVGALQLLAGVGVVVLGVGAAGRTGSGVGWPVVSIVAGLVVAAAAVAAIVRGPAWPALGARYERAGAPAGDAIRADLRTAASDQADGAFGGTDAVSIEGLWDAIQRGEDPTKI